MQSRKDSGRNPEKRLRLGAIPLELTDECKWALERDPELRARHQGFHAGLPGCDAELLDLDLAIRGFQNDLDPEDVSALLNTREGVANRRNYAYVRRIVRRAYNEAARRQSPA